VIPFVVQIGLYISPVGFVSGLVEERLGWWGRVIYSLNPMVGVIDGFRWCIGVQNEIFLPSILISLSVSLMMLGIGVAYFRATERSFADFI
jgi:lipopolysaccharide transport system permease protein